MASTPQHKLLEEHNRDVRNNGEPLLEDRVKVQGAGRGGNTPYVTATKRGAEIVGFDVGDKVVIEIFEDGIFIRSD